MPLQPQQKDLEDVSDPDDFDPHFRPKDITKDLAKLKKVTATGKKACLGGIAVSLVGSVISTVGLMRNAGATKFKNWFGVSLGAWILILAAQGVCTWEVLDRAKRHNEKLVNRCKWLYVAAVVLSTVLLLLLLSIWAVKGSFVDPDLSGTSSWVLLVLVLILLCFGIVPLLFVYFKYAKQIKNTDSHSARPKVPMTRTLSNAASSIKRTVSNRSKSSRRSDNSSRNLAYSPSDSDSLPEFPEYNYHESMESGTTVSRPVSTVSSRRDSTQTRHSIDDYYGDQGPPYPDSDLPTSNRNDSRSSTRTALRGPPTKTILPPSSQVEKSKRNSLPSSIPYVPRPSTPDFSSSSSDSEIDSSNELFLPRNPSDSSRSPRNSSQSHANPFATPRSSVSSIASPIWPPPNPYSPSTSRPTSPASNYRAYSPTVTSSPPPSRPVSSSSTPLTRSSTRKSANYPPGTATRQRSDRENLPSQSGGDSSSDTDRSVRRIRTPFGKGSLTVANPDLPRTSSYSSP